MAFAPSISDSRLRFIRRGPFRFLLAAIALAVMAAACSGEADEEPASTSTPAAQATTAAPDPTATPAPQSPVPETEVPATQPAPTPSATSEPSSSLDGLSLVYVDTRRGQGGDVYVADADGANPRLVVSENAFNRPLDVMGSTLAAVGDGGVLLIDLAGGSTHLIEEPRIVFDGAFFDEQTFFFTAAGSCTQGGGALYRVDLPSFESTELLASDLSLTIAGMDAAGNTLALLPRGCDPGIATIDTYDALTGELRDSYAVEGCGWAIAIPDQNKAVTSWQACTPPEAHAGADVTVYDFGIAGPTGQDVTLPDARPNAAIWLARPGHAEAALGATMSVGEGPGNERGAGIYALDLAGGGFTLLVEGEGAEQYPVAWSPDGRYLLYAVVEAQGVCHFAYVDTEAPGAQPVAISEEVTFCGINGHVVGWTELP